MDEHRAQHIVIQVPGEVWRIHAAPHRHAQLAKQRVDADSIRVLAGKDERQAAVWLRHGTGRTQKAMR